MRKMIVMTRFKILKKSDTPLPSYWFVLKKVNMGIIRKEIITPLSVVEKDEALIQLFIETCWVMIACFRSFEKHHLFDDIIDDCLEEWKETLCKGNLSLSVELYSTACYWTMNPGVVSDIKLIFSKVIDEKVPNLNLEKLFLVLKRELNSAPYRITTYPVAPPICNPCLIGVPGIPFFTDFADRDMDL